MAEITSHQRVDRLASLRIIVVLEAAIFLLAALQHLGLSIPFGAVRLAEARIIPAAVVEGISGILFVICALALFAGLDWAGTSVMVSHIFALAGVLLGIFSLSVSLGPGSPTNEIYHMIMLLLIPPGLSLYLAVKSEASENQGAAFFHWMIRITGVVQLFLGILFWIEQNDSLIPYHILIGSVLVISLWALAILAGQAGVVRGFVVVALVLGLIVVLFGLTQTLILPGPAHWVVEVLHLLLGLGAIGQGEGLWLRTLQARGRAS